MKKVIHVDQHVIKRNAKNGTNDPPITVKTYKSNTKGHYVSIDGPAVVQYRGDKPLSCGARVWIETEAPVTIQRDEIRGLRGATWEEIA